MVTLQELLNNKYGNNKGTNIIEIENQGNPTGSLDLTGYNNFVELKLYGDGVTDGNYFNTIQSIPNKEKITGLGFGSNQIINPRFDYIGANFPNLEWMSLSGNQIDDNISIKGLENCRKLRSFWLGLGEKKYKDMEYLPTSLASYGDKSDTQFFKDLKAKSWERETQEIRQLKIFKQKYSELYDQWDTDQLKGYFDNKLIHPDGIKLIKPRLDALTTENTQLKVDKAQLEKDKKQAGADRDKAKEDLKTANDNLTIANNKISTLEKEKSVWEEQQKTNDLINNKWKEVLGTEYGDKPTVGGILAIKSKLGQLASKDPVDSEKTDWEKLITERNQTITALNADNRVADLEKTLKNKNETISERDKIIESLKRQIKELEVSQASQLVEVEIPK